eukprot:9066412-Pyramimonas_sp.AAC.1
MADDLAKSTRDFVYDCTPPWIVQQLYHTPELEWNWLLDLPEADKQQYPFSNHAEFTLPCRPQHMCCDGAGLYVRALPATCLQPELDEEVQKAVQRSMILVTYNAETAQDTVKGERTVLRGQWLRQQFQEAAALLVGVQEARTPRG